MNVFVSLLLAAAAVLATRLFQFWQQPKRSPLARVRGPKSLHWWIGSFPIYVIKENLIIQWTKENFAIYGPSFAIQVPARQQALVTRDPVAVQHVMLSASPHYVKAELSKRLLATHFGLGLLAVDGEQHKRHRKVAWPAFTGKAVIDNMAPDILSVGDELVARFKQVYKSDNDPAKSDKGALINAYAEFTRAALDVIGLVGFNFRFNSLSGEETELGQAFDAIFLQLVKQTPYKLLSQNVPGVEFLGRFFSKDQKQLDKARAVVQKQSRDIVRAAKRQIEKESADMRSIEGHDLLTLLIKSNLSPDTKPSERMSDEEVVSMVPTFLAAGHETTSSALGWTAYALTTGSGPEKQKILRDELLDADNDGWQTSVKKLDSLPYLDALCKETLRLYCPVRATRRTCTRDDVIPLSEPIISNGTWTKSVPMAEGDNVFISISELNTCKEIWGADAESFRPERFLSEQHPLSDGKALPQKVIDSKLGWSNIATFTTGPRNCIGLRMAVMEMKVLLAKTIANFHLRPDDETSRVEYRNRVVARPQVQGHNDFYMPCRIVPVAGG